MNKVKLRSILLLLLDLFFVAISITFSMFVRYEFVMPHIIEQRFVMSLLPRILFVYLIVYKAFKLDKTVWVKVSIDEAMKIVSANLFATLILLLLRDIKWLPGFPISVIIMSYFVIVLMQFGTRMIYRFYRIVSIKSVRKKNSSDRILIYGAGSAGQMIAQEILENESYDYNIIGFIDDNLAYKGNMIYSFPIFGDKSMLPSVIEQYAIDQIFLAIPSISLKRQKEIISELLEYKVAVKKVSGSHKLLQAGNITNSLRSIDIADLLDRPEIIINDCEIKKTITNKTVLVTGAGGSIGSELVRQIVRYQPQRLVLLDINETGLYQIEQELNMNIRDGKIPELNMMAFIASIRDRKSLDLLFSKEKFDIVFHAAAHKHVPLMETAPAEAIKNNIFGTKNLIDMANKYDVEKFVNISTDKAVNPTNVMGATKRFIEMMLQSQTNSSKTKFMAVRFGNVLGSNGSAVPLFRKQIEQGGPVTVTHQEIERYFMTIPEAVSLVLQAASFAQGGEIFVLDMGEPVKILHLAEKVIELSGYQPYKDIDIVFTGLRPGEKLYEELLMAEENLRETNNKLIKIAKPLEIAQKEIEEKLSLLESVVYENNKTEILTCLQNVVPTYMPDQS
ncbi:MAG TPA: nucleoside-diphosphate sugar epimerase/dehydratase [Erysipelothrix sp.]